MSLPRIILICGITLCYVTRDGMYRHDSGQQILLVKSMRGGDETDVTKSTIQQLMWRPAPVKPTIPTLQSCQSTFLTIKTPCKVKWTRWIVGIMSSTGEKKEKKRKKCAWHSVLQRFQTSFGFTASNIKAFVQMCLSH